MPHRSDFGTPCCLRPSEAGSALGSRPFEATSTFTVVTAQRLVASPREALSMGFRISEILDTPAILPSKLSKLNIPGTRRIGAATSDCWSTQSGP
jgi:hypothetical protein